MSPLRRTRLTPAAAIFDPQDRFARERAVRGRHPRPLGALKYWLVARIVNDVRSNFAVPIELVTVRNPSGYDVCFGRCKQHGAAATRCSFEPGTYVLGITAQFYQAREYLIDLPVSQRAQLIDLEPAYNYPFPTASARHEGRTTLLRGTVHALDGQGVRGVMVEIAGGSNSYMTAADGQWVLMIGQVPPDERVTVDFKFADGTRIAAPAVEVAAGEERSLVQASLRGWVMTNAGNGIERARVSVSGHPGATFTAADGSWFYYFGLAQGAEAVDVIAQLPGGAALTQSNVQVQPRALVVVPSFKVA